MVNEKVFLSVVIPSYNEEVNFRAGCLDGFLEFLEGQKYSYEVIFSDDGSNDRTVELLAEFVKEKQPKLRRGKLVLLKNPHSGKTGAVRSGMNAGRGEWRLFTDFDQSTKISEVEKLLKYKDEGYAIIFGSRKMEPKAVKAKWYRKFVGDTFNLIVRALTGLKIKDTQCGFKLFSAEAAGLFNELYVYGPRSKEKGAFTGAFDVEIFMLAKAKGWRVKEVPVKWKHHATDRVNIVKDSARMFVDTIKIRWAARSGKYHKL